MKNIVGRVIEFLRPGVFPFSLAVFFSLFILVYRSFDFPSPSEIAVYSKQLYLHYGFWILLVASFGEALFMISMYFPGSFVILLAVLTIGNNDVIQLVIIGFLAMIGFTLANVVNYYLGKYGYYQLLLKLGSRNTVNNMHRRFEKSSFMTIFLTSFHPNFLSIAFVCAGIARYNLFKAVIQSIVSLIFWISLWTTIAALFISQINTEDPNTAFYFLALLILWGLSVCIFNFLKGEK